MKKTVLYIISLLCIFGFRFIPAASGMTQSGMQVLGIFLGTLILWLTTAIDWPSILCLAGLAFVPELTMNSILASSFGNSTFAFLLFTFTCTYALSQTSFVKRCAVAFISNRIAQKGSWWFVTLYCLSVLVIGMFISPVVLFVVYLPILDTICHELKLTGDDKLANVLALGQLFCCAFACGMTPIAHVFSVMSMGFYSQATGNSISYAQYMTAGIPVGLICFVVMMLIFRFVLNPDMSKLKNLDLTGLKKDIKPMDKKEISILSIFVLVVIMWVVPGFLKTAVPSVYTFFNGKGTTFPPMLGATALFLLSADGKPLINFKEAFGKGIQWGSLVMAAATLAIGSAMTNEDIGLTTWLSDSISPVMNGLSPMIIVLIFLAWTFIMTNTCSNMVTVSVVCAVAIPLCTASCGSINAAAVAALIGLGASFAFVLPPAHPNVAVAIGSGWTNTSQIVKYGAVMMVIALAVTMLVGYPIACSVMLF